VEDSFSIISPDLVLKLIGEYNTHDRGYGPAVYRPNGMVMVLAPPLTFRFRAQREAPDRSSELMVTGHFVGLLIPAGASYPCWVFDEEETAGETGRGVYSATAKLAHKQGVAQAVRALAAQRGGLVPDRLLDYLRIL